jgi:hypothetical protein
MGGGTFVVVVVLAALAAGALALWLGNKWVFRGWPDE